MNNLVQKLCQNCKAIPIEYFMQLSLFFEFQGNMTPGFPTFITLNLFPNPGNWAVRLTISVEIKYVNFFSFCSYEMEIDYYL